MTTRLPTPSSSSFSAGGVSAHADAGAVQHPVDAAGRPEASKEKYSGPVITPRVRYGQQHKKKKKKKKNATTDIAGTGTYTNVINHLCLLKQFGQSHTTEGDITSLDDAHAQSDHAGTPTERQSLLDALSFAAAVDATAQSVTAMTMEVTRGLGGEAGEVGVRFHVAMNGRVREDVVKQLGLVGGALQKAAIAASAPPSTPTVTVDDVEATLFDLVLAIKTPRLISDLFGKYGRPGLLSLLQSAISGFTTLEPHRTFPPYDATLHLSPEETDSRLGPYLPGSHRGYMERALEQVMMLVELVKKSRKDQGGKGKGKKRDGPGDDQGLDNSSAKEAIMVAYNLRSSHTVGLLLSKATSNSTSKAMQAIRKLGRYWGCCVQLLRCSRGMPCFLGPVSFHPVPVFEPRRHSTCTSSSDDSATLSTVNLLLKSVGSSLPALSQQTKLGESQILTGFESDLRLKYYVHAEMNLVYFHASSALGASGSGPEAEIGCSKHACFACYTFIRHHPFFRMEKTHTKIYPGWGLPALDALDDVHLGTGEDNITDKGTGKGKWGKELEEGILGAFLEDLRSVWSTIVTTVGWSAPTHPPPDSSSGVTATDNESVANSEHTAVVGLGLENDGEGGLGRDGGE